jgi:hypothetical protein
MSINERDSRFCGEYFTRDGTVIQPGMAGAQPLQ